MLAKRSAAQLAFARRLNAHLQNCLHKHAINWPAISVRDNLQYGVIIEEKIGLRDGLTEEYMLNAIEENMVASGARKKEIVVVDRQKSELGEREATQMAYLLKLNGLNFTFMSTFGMSEDTTLQFITWTTGKQLERKNQDLHADFLGQFETYWR